jgi:hypothetical protein
VGLEKVVKDPQKGIRLTNLPETTATTTTRRTKLKNRGPIVTSAMLICALDKLCKGIVAGPVLVPEMPMETFDVSDVAVMLAIDTTTTCSIIGGINTLG